MIDRFVINVLGIIFVVLGIVLFESALEGAGVLPHYFVRPGFDYTAYKAVTVLLSGQVSLAIGLAVPYWWAQADRKVTS